MDPNPIPLEKHLYLRAQELNVARLELRFSGGSDEGYLQVDAVTRENITEYLRLSQTEKDKHQEENSKIYQEHQEYYRQIMLFEESVDKWAWEVYSYSGAGDGSDYGDNITYNLIENKVETESWYTSATYEDSYSTNIPIWQEDAVTRLLTAIKAFEVVCSKHSYSGANDTEPQSVFQHALVDTFMTGNRPEITTVSKWQLFSSEEDLEQSKIAANELSDSLNNCLAVLTDSSCGVRRRHLWKNGQSVTPPSDTEINRELVKYLASYCWRVSDIETNLKDPIFS